MSRHVVAGEPGLSGGRRQRDGQRRHAGRLRVGVLRVGLRHDDQWVGHWLGERVVFRRRQFEQQQPLSDDHDCRTVVRGESGGFAHSDTVAEPDAAAGAISESDAATITDSHAVSITHAHMHDSFVAERL